MGSDITIRQMEEDDLRAVFLLWPPAPRSAPDEGADALAGRIVDLYIRNPELCFTALHRKKIIGFVMGIAVEAEGRTAGSVGMMTVDAGGRTGQVYGQLFARLCESCAERGISAIYSEQLCGDGRRELYGRLGFSPTDNALYLKYEMARE